MQRARVLSYAFQRKLRNSRLTEKKKKKQESIMKEKMACVKLIESNKDVEDKLKKLSNVNDLSSLLLPIFYS